MKPKLLIIDDDDSIRQTLTNYFKKLGYGVLSARDGNEGLEIFEAGLPDLIISDIRMPGLSGIEFLQKAKETDSHAKIILITAHDDYKTTIEAMQKGAYDYFEKPLDIEKLKIAVERALESKQLSERIGSMIEKEAEEFKPEKRLIGKSSSMKEIYKIIGQVSTNRVTVLIQGESGTGKELIAKSIHYSGITQNHPFVAVNCTAITESLLESELFGHEKGAFTGADRLKKGKFELAGEGTIFLDEISEMSPHLQVKLLRVLQEREFERVGGENLIPMKARIITATNRNLERLVKEGKFREDLYFRLKVVSIDAPPLRERKEDIPALVNYFLNKLNAELHKNVNKISAEAMEALTDYDWPGNVRELENTLMQAIVLSNDEVLHKENLLIKTGLYDNPNKLISLKEMEKKHIKFVLDRTGWDKPKAAEILGISLPTLYSKIENYGLNENDGKN
ncbi:two component, sigma54 specific, transcriptional regulator, Fis family [Melioribacter roseus P3M-2]|uniref:Two component, sigma54 specific, transcriptional regulator, Fis family n=1 Tax=Melioribacter roseus (strain DSM 23840 / JCM 17771 / VKM B-2668 / P3M-2) TaxID=1191523 RepID=I7A2H9_MELRP|nr:sigma-54 dependent transcriptional regulator [Melioribacter roseus]AFN74136.1 two component, sigma54 specific, transcriptional regulator, Fis family [Melioribacter roseus P3M-2]